MIYSLYFFMAWFGRSKESGDTTTKEEANVVLDALCQRMGVRVITWNNREYDYSGVVEAIPKIESVINSLRTVPNISARSIVLQLKGLKTGVITDTNNQKIIAIDYTQNEDVIRGTIEQALARDRVEQGLANLASRYNVAGIVLWNDREYDCVSIEREIPKIKAAIERLPNDTRLALQQQEITITEEGGRIGVTWDKEYKRKIGIDHTADEDDVLGTIYYASENILARSAVRTELDAIAARQMVCPIGLFGDQEYYYDQIKDRIAVIEEAIASLSPEVKMGIGSGSQIKIILQNTGHTGPDKSRGIIEINPRDSVDAIRGVIEKSFRKLPKKWKKESGVSLGDRARRAGNAVDDVLWGIRDAVVEGSGVKRVLAGLALTGAIGAVSYVASDTVREKVDAVLSSVSGPSDAPAPPEPVTSGAEAPRPTEGGSPVVPRVRPAPPAPEVTNDMRELVNTQMIIAEGVKLLNNGDVFGAKSKLLDAKRAAEKITNQAEKGVILDRINRFLSKAEAAE